MVRVTPARVTIMGVVILGALYLIPHWNIKRLNTTKDRFDGVIRQSNSIIQPPPQSLTSHTSRTSVESVLQNAKAVLLKNNNKDRQTNRPSNTNKKFGVKSSLRARNKFGNATNINSSDSVIPALLKSFMKHPLLSREEISGVEKFVMFIGYPRSGHSIIGTMMDSHPNMIIAHEYPLLDKLRRSTPTRGRLFNDLYQNSFEEATKGWRGKQGLEQKGYLLSLNSEWQAKFSQLRVIGNKQGGVTTMQYIKNSTDVLELCEKLQKVVKIPIYTFHVVRNPFDMISTQALYKASHIGHQKYKASETQKYDDPKALNEQVDILFARSTAVMEMTKKLRLTLLELHLEDMIETPAATISKMCSFLELPCPEDYMEKCVEKTYSSIPKSRRTVFWPEHLIKKVLTRMRDYPFFKRYSFEN